MRHRVPRTCAAEERLRLALACAVSIVLAPFSAVAEPPAAPDAPAVAPGVSVSAADLSAPTFVIEKIVVEGVRHGSEKIVAAETLLTPGETYSEAQLQQALHRVERLPFVVQAELSLRRGSERGRFELLIAVTEAKPVFYGGTFDYVLSQRCSSCDRT